MNFLQDAPRDRVGCNENQVSFCCAAMRAAVARRWVARYGTATEQVPSSMRIDPRTYTFDSQPREEDRERLKQAAEFGRLIVETSVDVTSACWGVAKGHDEQAVILMTHWHLIELLDGVVVLIGSGAIEPARLQLRAAFEPFLTLSFVLEKETENRGYAWLVVKDVLNRIRMWRRLDSSSESRRDFAELTARERVQVLHARDAREKAERLQEMLETEPRWKQAYEEYRRLKKEKFPKSRNRPEWFELYCGPEGPGLGTLARYLGYGSQYEILYRHWSDRVHGTDAYRRFKRGGIMPLPSADDVNQTISLVTTFAFGAMFRLHDYYLPDRIHEFAKWYVEEVRPAWAAFEPSPEIVESVRTGRPPAPT